MEMATDVSQDLERNKATYRRFVEEVINSGNIDVIPELFSPAYVDHSSPPGAPGGLDGVRGIPALFRGGFPDLHFTIEHMIAEGDLVATHVTGKGTQDGPFMGLPPSGRKANWSSMGFFRVEDGRIAEHWGSPDLLTLMTQLGAIPAPGGGGPAPSAAPPAQPTTGRIDPEEGKRVIQHHVVEIFNKHDLSELDEWLDDDYVYHAMGMDIVGLAGYKATVEPLFSAFPDVVNTPQALIAEGDLVAIRWSAKGTHSAPFMGVPATGKVVELTGITFERIAGGKRFEGWGVPDMLGLLRQLGAIPAPGGGH
jgi:steroid delta-isomerase-like uncharacterized protein